MFLILPDLVFSLLPKHLILAHYEALNEVQMSILEQENTK